MAIAQKTCEACSCNKWVKWDRVFNHIAFESRSDFLHDGIKIENVRFLED